jgi:guanylate kinase
LSNAPQKRPSELRRDIKRRGMLFVLSSPSGAGKSTISRRLLQDDDDVVLSVSVTTRPPRPGEVDGKDYHFIDIPRFEEMKAANDLLEHARVFDNYYGTPKGPVNDQLTSGKDVLFDIDWQGTQQVEAQAASDLVRVFILPPSLRELERRLKSRAQDSDEVVAGRMAKASDEMSHCAEYDYVVINDDLEETLASVKAILTAERLRRQRQPGINDFVSALRSEATAHSNG